jgi:hypothetical protein
MIMSVGCSVWFPTLKGCKGEKKIMK